MPYIITNGNVHLAKTTDNRYITTNKIHLAQCHDDSQKAFNRLKNMPHALKNLRFKVCWVENQTLQKREPPAVLDAPDKLPPCDVSLMLDGCIHSFQSIASQLFRKEEEYRTELSRLDREIVDIEHKAELEKLNARDGYKLYRLLRETCIRRRKCKDNLLVIHILHNSSVDDILSGSVSSRIDGLNKRKYTPRELPELFGTIQNTSLPVKNTPLHSPLLSETNTTI